MDIESVEEIAPLISRSGIPTAVRDTRQTYQKQLAVYFILASTVFERIAFYILAATLALTADSPHCNSTAGSIVPFIFTGTSNISTIIFAILSDRKLGRAKTTLVGFSLYLVGYILTTVFTSGTIDACPNMSETKTIFNKPCADWILPTLIVIAIGAGAVQSNMVVFGAEQIQETKITSRYFDKYVFAVNIGAILAKFAFPFIEKEIYIAYLYATSALFVAAVLFIIGWRYYIHVKPFDSVVINWIPVTFNAFQSWRQYQKKKRASKKKRRAFSSSSNAVYNPRQVTDEEESIKIDERPLSFLDFAKVPNGKFHDRIVDDVKSLPGAFVVFTLLIPYWLIYDQLNSTFRLQARYMQGAEVIPMAVVSLADPVIIIIGILILNIFVYKYLDGRNWSLTIETKLIIGMCFAVVSMCIAGSVEEVRRDQWDLGHNLSNLTIYTQIPQGICMGFSELFIMVASFEFAYFAAPRSAQTLFMSLRFCSIGISSFLGTAYITAFAASNFRLDFSCQMEPSKNWVFATYFFILAGLQLIFIIIFILCQTKYGIIRFNRQQIERGRFLRPSFSASAVRQ